MDHTVFALEPYLKQLYFSGSLQPTEDGLEALHRASLHDSLREFRYFAGAWHYARTGNDLRQARGHTQGERKMYHEK